MAKGRPPKKRNHAKALVKVKQRKEEMQKQIKNYFNGKDK